MTDQAVLLILDQAVLLMTDQAVLVMMVRVVRVMMDQEEAGIVQQYALSTNNIIDMDSY